MKLKLFPKIAILTILVATLPVILVGWQTATLNHEHLRTTILELNSNLANSLAKRIDTYLGGVTGKLRTLVEMLRIQGISSSASFRAFAESNNEFVAISFLKSNGQEVFKHCNESYNEDKKMISLSEDPVFQALLAQNVSNGVNPVFGFFFKDGQPRLKLFLPYDPSNLGRGAIHIVISLNRLWDEIEQEGAGMGGGGRTAFIADKQGRMIANSNPSTMEKILKDGPLPAMDHPLVAEALQKVTVGSKEYQDSLGQEMVGSYCLVKWTEWISVIEEPKEKAFAPVFQTRRRAMLVVFIAFLAAAAAAYVLAKGLSKPIFKLIHAARRVAQNDFNQRVKISSEDELGDLADTFNDMIWELKSYSELQVDRIIEEKTKTESVIFSIADGIVMTDSAGKIQIVNRQAAQAFEPDSKSQGQVNPWAWVGKNILDALAGSPFKEIFQKALVEHGAQAFKEIAVTRNEETRHFQVSTENVLNPRTKKELGVVTVLHDVTLERELDKLKESFLHSITHDLRNPMTSIQGFIKFLLEQQSGPLNDAQKSMLDTMERASNRFLGMINDILDIAKLEAGKFEIQMKTFELDPIIDNLRNLYLPMAEKRSIELTAAWKTSLRPVHLTGEESLIERVAGNLIANAIKFTPMKGKITIQVLETPDQVEISVTDTGPGIPEDAREKVFDKFQQLGAGRQKGGTGLGLTICKYFVELHKGKIWVEAGEGGKGSKFAFRIPKDVNLTSKSN